MAGPAKVGRVGIGAVSEPAGQSKYEVGTWRMRGGKDELVCHQSGQNEDVLRNLVLLLFRNATLKNVRLSVGPRQAMCLS